MTEVHADLEAIRALRAGLLTFAGRCHDALLDADYAVTRATQALDSLEADTRDRVSDLTDLLYECYDAAVHGMAADCGQIQHDLSRAERHLARILRARRRFQDAAEAWYRQRYALENALDGDLSAAVTYLDRRGAALEAYEATHLTAAALALGRSGYLDLMGVAIGAMRIAEGHMRRVLGRAGEETASQVLSQRFGLQEVSFAQPAHGFDRVFRAPGLPLIVVESKVSQGSKLRLGQTAAGEQGSPGWLAHTAENMTDPTSAQWSPTNARLGRLVHEMGPENIPVLAVVTDYARFTASVYGRQPAGDWELIEADIDLNELHSDQMIAETSENRSMDPVDLPSPWSEQAASLPAERREGAPGGVERKG